MAKPQISEVIQSALRHQENLFKGLLTPKKVRSIRKLLKLTVQQMAHKIGCHWFVVYRAEHGKSPLNFRSNAFSIYWMARYAELSGYFPEGTLDSLVEQQEDHDEENLEDRTVQLLWKTKGLERMLVATDAMAGAGLPDGEYLLAGQKVAVKDGRTISPEGKIAGGIGTMNLAVRNASHWLDIPIHEAVALGSYNPACVLGVENCKGSLERGKDADLFLCDSEFHPVLSMVMGKIVYRILS